MKLKILLLGLILILVYSCEEDLNPNAEFLERNVLTCVVRSDTNYQVLTLTRSYQVEGLDPNENKIDPAIKNADVKMWYNNKAFQFKDSSVARINNERYNTPVSFYYNNEMKPTPGKDIEVEALLPNGLLLRSVTTVPKTNSLYFTGSNRIISLDNKFGHIEITWTKFTNLYYHPVLSIKYYDNNLGDNQIKVKVVPIKYITSQGVEKPFYPIPSEQNTVTFDQTACDRAMREISGDNPVKSDYSILDAELKLMVFDENLSAYYSSVGTFLDGFTIKVDQPDFTNINGGFGIFGSYSIKYYKLNFTEEYVQSFGYVAGITGF
ncbi:MAG: DUF4249 domain-containing protein [Bacteroidetes bacterium]|nr:DUF4249 domain-containing protein [Bacteroidota bacterium]